MKRALVVKLIYGFIGALAVAGSVWLFIALIPEPPVQEMEVASEAIARARDHNSVIYSASLYREARSFYDSAMISWKTENRRFILFRDYERVRTFAAISAKKAAEATAMTIVKSNDLRSNLESEIARLNGELEDFEEVFSSLPLPQEIKKKNTKGKLLLNEAEIAYEKEQYVAGNVKIREAGEYITDSYNFAREKLVAYFAGYKNWQELAGRTIRESRDSSRYAIIVEKIPGVCHLYHRGVKKYTFDAEFGKNWMGDKMRKGDEATPEGCYVVTRKLSNGSTKYHKALLINYPNQEDLEEFKSRISTGQIPEGSKIGGLIEIHGDGGKGTNWTEGCVALRNSDMDILFKYVTNGTPVTIIGSSIPLEEYISKR